MMNETQKQEKLRKNFLKAQQLRKDREMRERAAEERRVACLERDNSYFRQRPRSLPIAPPQDYTKQLIDRAAAHAAMEMHRPIADMFGSPPWSAAIGQVSRDLFMGAWRFARIDSQGTIEMDFIREAFSGNYRFSLHIPPVDVNYIIDNCELEMARQW